jgi:hypothetical protein
MTRVSGFGATSASEVVAAPGFLGDAGVGVGAAACFFDPRGGFVGRGVRVGRVAGTWRTVGTGRTVGCSRGVRVGHGVHVGSGVGEAGRTSVAVGTGRCAVTVGGGV